MTSSANSTDLLPKIDQLIDLLQQVLSRDAHPLMDRLDEYLAEISRIERSMILAAEALSKVAPQLLDMPTRQELAMQEDRLTDWLEAIVNRQDRIEMQLKELFVPVGLEDDG